MKMVVTRARGWMIGAGLSLGLVVLAGCRGSTTPTQGKQGAQEKVTTATSVATATTAPSAGGPLAKVTTITATGSPTTGPTPAWRKAALPSGFGDQFHSSDVEPAPSDGNTVYACAAPADMVTSANAGASFGPLTEMGDKWGSCALVVVDKLEPSRVLAYPDYYAPGALSTDGGATWQPFSSLSIRQMATVSGTTYAVAIEQTASGSTSALLASTDNMRSWHPITVPLPNADTTVIDVWVQPGGDMIIQTYDRDYPYVVGLLHSADGGNTWTQPAVPSNTFYGNFVFVAAGAHGAWNICGMYDTSNTDATMNLACSTDTGATWTVLPQLENSAPGSNSSPGLSLDGLAADGTVFAQANTNNGTETTLYRWTPGSTRWQSLGTLPSNAATVRYYPTSAGGVLWAFPAESDGGSVSGQPNDIYSAPVPA